MRNKITIMFGIVLVLTLFLTGYMHESVHQEIYKNYGMESEIELWQSFPHMVTTATCKGEYCGLSEEDYREMNSLHLQNEITSYNMTGIYILLGLGLFFIIAILEEKNE